MKTIVFCLGILLLGQLTTSSEGGKEIFFRIQKTGVEKAGVKANKKQEKAPSGENTIRIYAADLEKGVIGHGTVYPLDDPFDNVFHLFLDETPEPGDEVWLKYELEGVQDLTAVSRSINDRQAIGGCFIQQNINCTRQQEQIAPGWLKKGDNVIRFSLPEGAGYHYKIFGLTLEIEKNNTENKIAGKNIITNQPVGIYYGNKAYVQGFLAGPGALHAKLYANGLPIPLTGEEFECILEKPEDSEPRWEVELKAVYPDGTEIRKNLFFDTERTPEFTREVALKGMHAAKTFSPDRAEKLVFSGATLELPAGALTGETAISITALRDIDLPPLNPDMVNVTRDHKAYRFLPHGLQFQKAARIRLEYDPGLIPQGYNPKDVRTFFFDEIRRAWLELPQDSLDAECGILSSTTTHFTDFINGIIKVPESPETQGYKPTEIKDLKAPDPSAGITMIAPPSPNQMGTAGLQFPLKLPGGRQGLQPQLAIQYNSEGGNGWLGLGWDLSVPSFTIDTRWGVPDYHPDLETETYTMNGEQLIPLAHREALINRSGPVKQFYPRIEGSFQKIIRHGNSPKNYWWEVVSKDGTRSFYGGDGNSMHPGSVLRDASGNIAYWALREVRDLNDNFIRYHFFLQEDAGLENGIVPGFHLYLDYISYTGHGTAEGQYQVRFERNRDIPGDARRPDPIINGRLGFKQVIGDRLSVVNITFNGMPVRSYELFYETGAFEKSLLSLIVETDAEKKEIYRHGFEYYSDVRSGEEYNPYHEGRDWNAGTDNIKGDLLKEELGFDAKISALGGSKSSGYNVGAAITVGPSIACGTKTFSAGGSFQYGKSNSSGLIASVDINGDGLTDKVFRNDAENKLYYRANLAGTGVKAFGPAKPITGINQFSKSSSKNKSKGLEGHLPFSFLGYTNSRSKTVTGIYFSDFNGDGLIDIASGGRVWFNRLINGEPVFANDSANTPNPIVPAAALDESVLDIDPDEQMRLIDDNPLHDVVRMWQAPFDGTITINASVWTIPDNSVEGKNYNQKDGVKVIIQHNDLEISVREHIEPGDTINPIQLSTIPNPISIKKGDRIFFRLQSNFDGDYDQVKWDPEITYLTINPDETDANGLKNYRYKASEDFLISSPQFVSMPFDGEIQIQGVFTKPQTSDNLTLKIIKRKGVENSPIDIIYYKNYASSDIETTSISLNFPVEAEEEVSVSIEANTNIDWKAISFAPQVSYVSVTGAPPGFDPGFSFCPSVDFSMYNDVRRKTSVWVADQSDTLNISPFWQQGQNIEWPDGKITLSVKKNKQWLGGTTFEVVDGNLPPQINHVFPVGVEAGDSLYFEYHIHRPGQADSLFEEFGFLPVTINGNDFHGTGIFSPIQEKDIIFGHLYRGWGQFIWDGNKEKATMKIDQNQLMLDPNLKDPELNVSTDLNTVYDPTKAQFIMMYADAKASTWRGYDDLTWLRAGEASSSRMGEDDMQIINPSYGGPGFMAAPDKITETTTHNVSAGGDIPVPGINLSGSAFDSWATTETTRDAIDVDGDRVPDWIGREKIQYTNARGGLEPNPQKHGFEHSHVGTATTSGVSAGGTYSAAKPVFTNSANENSPKNNENNAANVDCKDKNANSGGWTASASVGLSGNFNINEDDTENTWLDINGDGLPDKVFADGTVALNIGYKFTEREPWGYESIRSGKSTDIGGGLSLGAGLDFASNGINKAGLSFSFGVSLSRTDGELTGGLQDLNGDGLVDIVILDNPVRVRFNTGSGFTDQEYLWNGIASLEENASTGSAINGAFTVCIHIPFIFVKICINPSGSKNWGTSRDELQISDIDGDGFPDVLRSEEDGKLNVQSSTIKRTNLLKTIHTPLGGAVTLDYEITKNTYAMPQSKWLLSSVETDDGLPDDGPSRMKTTFEYQNGYYDRRQREFYGFKTVISRQLDTGNDNEVYRTTTQVYENSDYYRKGILLSETLRDKDGKKYTETLNTYEYRDIHTGAILQDTYFTDNETGAVYPALIQTIENHYEGQPNPGLYTRMAYDYDEYGNVISYTDDGNGDPAELIHARIGYHIVPDKHLVSIPSSIEVSINTGLIRKREADIDATGSVTQIRQFLDGATSANFDMEYDIYGNLTKITRPPNENGERVWFAYEYDDKVQTYPVLVRDVYGDTSRAVYDYRFGLPLETVDKNQQAIRYTLDAAGRIATVTSPYELASGAPYTISNSYFPQAEVAYAITRHFDPETGQDIETYTFMDGLGRPVQVKKTGSFFAGEDRPDEVAMIVSGRVVFDGLGRTVEAYYPTREPEGNNDRFNDEFDNVNPTKTTYDVLDRQLTTTLPDGAQTQMSYSIGPDNSGLATFVTAVTDALGNKKESYTDIRNRQRATTDHGPGPIWTTFRYNAISELLKVTDTGGNETQYTYDQLGRKLTAEHPDNGLTEFFYDLAGNMTRKVTAEIRAKYPNDGAIKYTYNLGRLIRIDYPKNFQNQVKFHYGTAGDQHHHNARGRIWLQEDATGGQEFFYGPLGEVTKTIRTVLINGNTSMTFISEQEYDTWNRIQKMKYPDGEVVDYHYNRAGKLNKMTARKLDQSYTFVGQLGYDKFEQRIFLKYGNGTTTKYEYEPERRRLSHLVARGPGRIMMDNRYEYDPMNNVLSIRNSAQAGVSELGGATYNQFVYDDLYRLVSAAGEQEKPGGREAYTLAMEYDNLHNIRRKAQSHNRNGTAIAQTTYTFDYLYDPARPHAPTRIGDKSYTYDANGNQTGWTMDNRPDFRKIHWDEENRITAIQDNGYLSRYTYDAAGERVIKSHGGIQAVFVDGGIAGPVSHDENYTAYISPYLVYREQGFTKHYYIEDQRILSKIGTGDFYTNTIPLGEGITAGNQNYADRRDSLKQALIRFLTDLGYNVGVPSLEDNIKDLQDAGIQVPVLEPGDYTNPPYGWPVPPLTHADSICAPWPPDPREANATNGNVEAGYGFIGYAGVPEFNQFFYHPDHLGSTSYITDLNGSPRQYAAYIPFGEVFFEEHINSPTQSYLFNAKELDRETGLYYYGARYYDPRISLWASVDPMAEKYAGWSGYNYTLWNPVVLVDPDGRKVKFAPGGNASDANIKNKIFDPRNNKTPINPKFKQVIEKSLKEIGTTKVGKELLKKLENLKDQSGNDVDIFIGENSNKELFQKPLDDNTHIISIDANFNPETLLKNILNGEVKKEPASTTRILAHELGHSTGTKDDGVNNMNNVEKHENPIMRELEKKERTTY